MDRRLPSNSGDLLLQVAPGWTFCAGAAQVGREPGDFVISKRRVSRHHQPWRTVRATDTVQYNLNEIGRFGQRQCTIESEFRPRGKWALLRIVVACDAG